MYVCIYIYIYIYYIYNKVRSINKYIIPSVNSVYRVYREIT